MLFSERWFKSYKSCFVDRPEKQSLVKKLLEQEANEQLYAFFVLLKPSGEFKLREREIYIQRPFADKKLPPEF